MTSMIQRTVLRALGFEMLRLTVRGNSVMIKQLARKVEDLEARAEQPHGRLDALERGLAELTQIVTKIGAR